VNLCVFGATGATGRLLTEQALARGHEVVVFARSASKLSQRHPRLTVLQGDLEDAAAVGEAVRGSDAVISLLGPRSGSKQRPLVRGMRNILEAMEKHGVRRIVQTLTPSSPDPKDSFDLKLRLMVGMVKLGLRAAYEEIVGMGELLRRSDRDWTIVRVPLLNDKPASGKVRIGYPGQGILGTFLSRSDLAAFVLDETQNRRFVHQAPMISN